MHIAAKEQLKYHLVEPYLGNPYALGPILGAIHLAFYSWLGFTLPARTAPYLWNEQNGIHYLVHIGHDTLSIIMNALFAGYFSS